MFKMKAGVALLLASLYPNSACAMDDSQARLAELESRIKSLTEAMGQQIQALSGQVQTLQSQLQDQQARQDINNKLNEDLVKASIREVGGFKDGLILEDGGDWRLQLNGGIQADYRHFSPDEQNTDTFSVRRANLTTTMFIHKYFSFQIGAEYANDNTGSKATTTLTNGYFEFSRWPQAKVRIGQFRPLFTLEHVSNDNYLGYLERSLAYNLSVDLTLDRGVMLHGAPIRGIYYSVALTNGTGWNNDNQTSADDEKSDGFDTTLRVRANFAELYNINDSVIHLGGSYNQGTLTLSGSARANTATTEGRGVKFFSADVFDGNDVDRTRWGIESAVARGPIKLMAEYVNLNYEGRSAADNSFDRGIDAWYASAQWIVTGESYADSYSGGVFNRIRPNREFDGKDNWGAVELGLRYSHFDASDFELPANGCVVGSGCLTTNYTNEAEAWTLAASWIFNPFVRVMANYVRTDFEGDVTVSNGKTSDHEDTLAMRAQFNF